MGNKLNIDNIRSKNRQQTDKDTKGSPKSYQMINEDQKMQEDKKKHQKNNNPNPWRGSGV
jgi:hypothetical protein